MIFIFTQVSVMYNGAIKSVWGPSWNSHPTWNTMDPSWNTMDSTWNTMDPTWNTMDPTWNALDVIGFFNKIDDFWNYLNYISVIN